MRGGRRPTKQSLKLLRSLRSLAMTVSISYLVFTSVSVFAEGQASPNIQTDHFETVEAEIMEVEELKEPAGSAIFTVKDLASGKTLRFFADPYLSLIQSGGKTISAGDVLGGSKAAIIYRQSPERDTPEIIFAKINSSYY